MAASGVAQAVFACGMGIDAPPCHNAATTAYKEKNTVKFLSAVVPLNFAIHGCGGHKSLGKENGAEKNLNIDDLRYCVKIM